MNVRNLIVVNVLDRFLCSSIVCMSSLCGRPSQIVREDDDVEVDVEMLITFQGQGS